MENGKPDESKLCAYCEHNLKMINKAGFIVHLWAWQNARAETVVTVANIVLNSATNHVPDVVDWAMDVLNQRN